MDSKTAGALIRIGSLMGIHSVSTMSNGISDDFYDSPVVNASAGAVFTIPLNQNATFLTEEPESSGFPVLEIADRLNRNYPARIYLLEGDLEHLYPSYDRNMANVIQQMYQSEEEQEMPGNIPSYTADHIDWSYPNIIIYATEYKRDKQLVEEIVARLDSGSGALVCPGQFTMIPIDRISLPAAMSTILARGRELADMTREHGDQGQAVYYEDQTSDDTSQQYEATEYFNPEFLNEFEEVTEPVEHETESKPRRRRSRKRGESG